jgi:hypothetical protein
MAAGSEPECKRFVFIPKKYPVSNVHPFSGGAAEAAIDFQAGVATQG